MAIPRSGAAGHRGAQQRESGRTNLATTLQIPTRVTLRHYDHHLTHAASAAYTSPFDDCAVAVIDAFGEGGSASFYHYRDRTLQPVLDENGEPAGNASTASLGFFYARVCALCGFDPVKGEEWRDGPRRTGPCARSCTPLNPQSRARSFIVPSCDSAEKPGECERFESRCVHPASLLMAADLARTGQHLFEEVMTDLLVELHARAPSPNLALAGGCALNSSYNGHVLERTPFQRLHVPSAPADDGTAVGAALLAFHEDHPSIAARLTNGTPYPVLHIRDVRNMAELGGLLYITTRLTTCTSARRALSRASSAGCGSAEFARGRSKSMRARHPRPRNMKDCINARVKLARSFDCLPRRSSGQRGPSG
jgi:carbamoyltransferase